MNIDIFKIQQRFYWTEQCTRLDTLQTKESLSKFIACNEELNMILITLSFIKMISINNEIKKTKKFVLIHLQIYRT